MPLLCLLKPPRCPSTAPLCPLSPPHALLTNFGRSLAPLGLFIHITDLYIWTTNRRDIFVNYGAHARLGIGITNFRSTFHAVYLGKTKNWGNFVVLKMSVR